MELVDDRTPEQKKSHKWLIIGTDHFMSGWGTASGGKSYAAWACEEKHKDKVFDWVSGRSDMKNVREVYGSYYPRSCAHCHIYVVEDNHPALG